MKQALLLSISLLISCFSFSQQIDLQISITDSLTSTPLPFVTVYLKKSGIGTTTNMNGVAVISFSKTDLTQDTLICSYISYNKEYVLLELNQSQQLNITLKPLYQDVKEVTIVSSKKILTAKQIVKKVLKNTPDNYNSSSVNLLGLYRETFLEDNKAVYLNEASINIHYMEYPLGRFDRKKWTDWHYDDSYAFEFNFSRFDGFPNQFNGKDDRVEIIEARSTKNWSKHGYTGSIVGGPLSITAKDYLKYQSDFLDKSNFDKYTYEKKGIETVNGKNCYAIHFYPNETGRDMSIFLGRKLKRSIYVGKMYVDKESFAVVKMEFQLAHSVDFGYYTKFLPLDYKVEIDYAEKDQVWSLSKLKLTQTRVNRMRATGTTVIYESNQELFITAIITDTVKQIPKDIEWRHTRITTLRDRELPFNSEYWKAYEASEYPELPASVREDLSFEKPLEQQFNERFKQIDNLPTPIAKKVDFTFYYPTDTLKDSYQWFSDPSNSPDLYKHIALENEYADNYIIPFRKYQKKFFKARNSFYPKDTTTVEHVHKAGNIISDKDTLENWILYEYTDSVNRIPIFNITEFESIRVDCYVSKIKYSKNNLAVDYTSNGGLNNNVILLSKGSSTLLDSISEVYSYEWLNDSILYYTKKNAVKRSDKMYRRNVFQQTEVLVKTELDLTYDISISKSESYLFCTVQSMNETEIYTLKKNATTSNFHLLKKRAENVSSTVKEYNGVLYMITNENAINNKILVQKADSSWQELVPHSKNTLITDFIVTENYIVIDTYTKSFHEIIYKSKDSKKWNTLEFKSEFFDASLSRLKNDALFINYSSPNQPSTSYRFDLKKEDLKEQDKSKINRQFKYTIRGIKTERLWAKSSDGVKVPITITTCSNPTRKHKGLVLKAYGSYGAFPGGQGFSAEEMILLKDGYTIAYAHVRGGLIMGNQWHKDGKLLNKENTFNDYIACAEFLIKKEYTDPDHLVGYGMSAGGLLMGVVINRRPELFNTVILDHPYLDALTSMMNNTLPLTTDHYKEIGNPNEKEYYDYIKGYSPYENIAKQDYPNLLFIGSSNDYQTPTSQIAKYVARVRELNTGDNLILYRTDIGSGHMGSTIGKNWMKDLSFEKAFIYGNLFN